MKKIFSLLGLLICVMSAWGTLTPVTISYSSTSTTEGWGTSVGGRFDPAILNNDVDGYFLSVNQSSRNNNGAVVTGNVISGKAEAGDDFTVTFDLRISSSSNQTNTEFKILDAANGANILSLKETGTWATTWIINGDGTKTVNLPNSNKAGSGNTITDVPWYSVKVCRKGESTYLTITDKASGDAILTKEAIATQSANGGLGNIQFVSSRYLGNFAINNIVVRAIQDGDAPAGPAYSINYKLGSTIIKTESGEAPVGTKLNSKADFWENNVKYYAINGAQEFTNTDNPANNIFDVALREANNYKYTVTTNDVTIASGSGVEGETVVAPYPQFYLDGTTLYETQKTNDSKKQYNISITLDQDNKVATVPSSQKATGVVYYKEGENIDGMSACGGSNVGVRCSNGKAGTSAAAVTITTLPAGVYSIGVGEYDNSSNNHHTVTFTAGNQNFEFATTAVNQNQTVFENVVISAETDFVFNGVESANNGLDYIYIQKTANFVATDELIINEAEITIGETAKMTATLLPANATNKKLTWYVAIGKSLDAGQAEIDEEGNITPIKAGLITVEVTNGEKTVTKEFAIAAAQFAATISGVPASFADPVNVFVGEDKAENGETLYVSTKDGYENMQNTSLLQPEGSVTATKIPTYIYSIAVDKKNKTVDVVYEEDIEVTAMEFEVDDQRIAMGNARTLQVTYSPANASFKTATWTSSDETVATIDAKTGLVTAVGEGTTTITATWSENEEHGTNISAQMTLTVDKGLVVDRIVYDELDDATAEVMGYYHPMDGDTLYLPEAIVSNGREIPVSFIKQEAFIGSNLKSIVIPGTVKTIDHRALMYSNTHNAYEELPEDGLESAFLMEGVEVMRDRIFHGNKYMKKVFLPSTLTDIGYYSFFGTAIEDVYFGGTEDQWAALKNLEYAKLPETAKIHYNSNFAAAIVSGIEVEEDYVELAVGEEYEIEATVTPESIAPFVELTYTSSNEEVAIVDEEGEILAVSDGYATITISAGGEVEAKVRVKVGDAARDFSTPLLTTWSVQGGANPEGIFVDEETHYYNNWGAGTSWFAQAYAQFDLSNLLPTDDFKATFTVWVNCARGTRNFDICGLSANATVADCQELTAKKGVELATYSDITTEYTAKEVDVTEYLKTILSEGASTAIFIMSNGAAGGNIYGKGSAEFAPTLNIYPANGSEGGNQATGISEAQADQTLKNGKYVENDKVIILLNGKKFGTNGQQLK